MKGKIGVQMMMLREKVEEPGLYEVFRTLRELDFGCVEVSQIPMSKENVDAMKKASEDFEPEIAACSAVSAPYFEGMKGEFLTSDFEKIVADCHALNCRFLRIGMLPMNCMDSYDKALAFAVEAESKANRLAAEGIELYYHNQHIEFVKYNGTYLPDLIRDHTSAPGFEPDVHWIHRGGEDPVRIIREYAGRVKLLHLKDYRISEVKPPKNPNAPAAFLQAFVNNVEFAEAGQGNLEFCAIMAAGLESGSEYFLIEQDMLYGRDPFDALVLSRDHLIEIGYEAFFWIASVDGSAKQYADIHQPNRCKAREERRFYKP